ncbi:MAG: fumarylacetoacetate hydrolase family protein [Candidatus Kapaibacterium sp.]
MNRTIKLLNGKEIQVGTMYCIGRNYAAHAREMGATTGGRPVIFIKPPAAYIESGEEIIIPEFSSEPHHEVELIAVVGEDCRDMEPEQAITKIAGYGVGIDVTLRDVQATAKKEGKPWATAKSFVTSAPISRIVPAEKIKDPQALEIELKINEEVRQKGSTANMIRTVAEIASYLSKVFTLVRGDVIFTGTPEGVGPMRKGDSVVAQLKGYVDIITTVR